MSVVGSLKFLKAYGRPLQNTFFPRRVYSLGRKVGRLLSGEGVFYWTSGGTTLGIVRHGGLIPWDDDIDLCVLEKAGGVVELQFFLFLVEGGRGEGVRAGGLSSSCLVAAGCSKRDSQTDAALSGLQKTKRDARGPLANWLN